MRKEPDAFVNELKDRITETAELGEHLGELLGEDFFNLNAQGKTDRLANLLQPATLHPTQLDMLLDYYPVLLSQFFHSLSREGVDIPERLQKTRFSTPTLMRSIFTGNEFSPAEIKPFFARILKEKSDMTFLNNIYEHSKGNFEQKIVGDNVVFNPTKRPTLPPLPNEADPHGKIQPTITEEVAPPEIVIPIATIVDFKKLRKGYEKTGIMPVTFIPEDLQARYFLENITPYIREGTLDEVNRNPLVINLAKLIGVDFFYVPAFQQVARLEEVYKKQGDVLLDTLSQLKESTGDDLLDYLFSADANPSLNRDYLNTTLYQAWSERNRADITMSDSDSSLDSLDSIRVFTPTPTPSSPTMKGFFSGSSAESPSSTKTSIPTPGKGGKD